MVITHPDLRSPSFQLLALKYKCITIVVVVDWSQRGEYVAKHGITVEQANEALADPDAVTIVPDPRPASPAAVSAPSDSPSASAM